MAFCSHCGAASVHESHRTCQNCGRPLSVEAADAAGAAGTVGDAGPAAQDPPVQQPDELQVIGEPAREPATGGRHLGKVLALGALVVALAGGGFLTYTLMSSDAGAANPEEAVTTMLQAVADQDGVAALSMVNPGETDGLDGLYEALREKAADAGFASTDDAVLDAVSITLEGLEVDVEEKGENAARVHVLDGTLSVKIDESKLPEDLRGLTEFLPSGTLEELETIDLSEVIPDAFGSPDAVFLTTVKRDGRWFVSPTATIGEYVVAENGSELTASDFDKVAEDNAPDPLTSPDPEGALGVLVEAISSNSVETILAALPEDQVAALRPFTTLLQDELQGTDGADLELTELETEFTELNDDRGRLTVNKARLAGTIDGDDGFALLEGLCVTSSDDAAMAYNPDAPVETTKDCLPEEIQEQTGIDALTFILQRTDGGWQVDPLATLVEYATRAVETFDPSSLEDAFPFGPLSDEAEPTMEF